MQRRNRHVAARYERMSAGTMSHDESQERRLKFLFHGPQVFAGLSIVGSILLLVTVYRTRKTIHKLTTYNRLMLGISISDLILSSALVLGSAPVPRSSGFPGARGNEATCTAQGFFLQLGNGTICYSQMLLLHYVLIIRYNVREQTLTKYIEPWMHMIPIGYDLITAFVSLKLDLLHPANVYCWIAPTPTGCEYDPTVECDRDPSFYSLFAFYVNGLPNLVYVALLTCYMCIIGATVVQKYNQSRRYCFESSITRAGQTQKSFLQDEKTRQVIVQCCLYAFWFLNVGIWVSICSFFTMTEKQYDFLGKHFWIVSMSVITFPLQGFFNLCIYIRPRYLSIRQGPLREEGRWFAIREAIWYPVETRVKRECRASFSRHSTSEKAKGTDLESIIRENDNISGSMELSELGGSSSNDDFSSSLRNVEDVHTEQEEELGSPPPEEEKSNAESFNVESVARKTEPRLHCSQPDLFGRMSIDMEDNTMNSKSVRFAEPDTKKTSGLRRGSSLPNLRECKDSWRPVDVAFADSVQLLFGLSPESWPEQRNRGALPV